jgi:hypothetical protein
MKKTLVFYAAGSLGALANSITVWLFGYLGVTSSLGVSIAPSLSPDWLYPRIVWGGLWGLIFFLPILKSRILFKGAKLFVVFPMKANKGIVGLELGLFTPAFVLFFNWVWGDVTAVTIKLK